MDKNGLVYTYTVRSMVNNNINQSEQLIGFAFDCTANRDTNLDDKPLCVNINCLRISMVFDKKHVSDSFARYDETLEQHAIRYFIFITCPCLR